MSELYNALIEALKPIAEKYSTDEKKLDPEDLFVYKMENPVRVAPQKRHLNDKVAEQELLDETKEAIRAVRDRWNQDS